MDFEETVGRDLVGFDERTETWFLRARESQRLKLTRPSLLRLVQVYNGIHQGRPLVLVERRELERLESETRAQEEELRALRSRRPRPGAPALLPRLARMLAKLLPGRR